MSTAAITNLDDIHYKDVIDLRDLVELRDDLRARTLCDNCDTTAYENAEGTVIHELTGDNVCPELSLNPDRNSGVLSDMLDADELALLTELNRFEAEEMNGDLDYAARNEPTLISDTYFEEYAKDWADGVGYLPNDDGRNPLLDFIDWPAWAEYMKTDYDEVELAGIPFLYRSA